MPVLVEGDDLGMYVVKLRGAGQGAKALTAELIVGALAAAAKLPVPEIVFVDLETTGGSTSEHRITEVGVVEIGPAGVSRWSSLVDPQQPIPSFIQQLTGITNAMVRGAPTFAFSAVKRGFKRMPGMLGGYLDGGEVFNIKPGIQGRSGLGWGWGDRRFAHEYLGVKSMRCTPRLKACEFARAGSRGPYSCGSGDFSQR